MSVPARPGASDRMILVVSMLGCLEFLGAGLAAAFSFQEAGAPVLLGLSAGRLLIVLVALGLSGAVLGAGLWCNRRRFTFRHFYDALPASLRPWLVVAGIVGAGLCWMAIFLPAYAFGERAGIYSRLQPLLIAAGLLVVELSVGVWGSVEAGTLSAWRSRLHVTHPRTFYPVLLGLLGLWLAMLASGFGIRKISQFWNPPGVPLTGLQGLALIGFLCIGVVFSRQASRHPDRSGRRIPAWILPLSLYICALAVWGLTPMERHYFSLRPAAPSFEPFPYSDARSHDLGAISIIHGQGIFFHGFTDKPLYMVFLAFLHALGGNNYVLLVWLQLTVLAGIPVVLFFLGRQFHSDLLGAAVALMIIVQQGNSIRAALDIDSVNAKLLMTEVPTMLAMVVTAYLLFKWFRTQTPQLALASGAAIGAASLVRVNPLFLLPVAGLFAVVVFRRQRRLISRSILLFSAGFIVVFTPWVLTGVNDSGVPWLWIKMQFVIQQRFQSMVTPADQVSVPETGTRRTPRSSVLPSVANLAYIPFGNGNNGSDSNSTLQNTGKVGPAMEVQGVDELPAIPRSLSHALHNMAAVVLSLPDIVTLDNLENLGSKDPWGSRTWTGSLTLAQHAAALGNIILLSVGLAWSWRRFRLAGLVPALVFAGYDLSLAAAATSGGRYVVPVNWVAYFYYALGLIAIIGAFVGGPGTSSPISRKPAVAGMPIRRESFLPTIAAVVLLAILVPIANSVVPILIRTNIEARAQAAVAGATRPAEPGVQWAYGQVLYPYYHASTRSISFDLLNNTGYWRDLTVSKDDVFPRGGLQEASLAAAGLFTDNTGLHVKSLYVGAGK